MDYFCLGVQLSTSCNYSIACDQLLFKFKLLLRKLLWLICGAMVGCSIQISSASIVNKKGSYLPCYYKSHAPPAIFNNNVPHNVVTFKIMVLKDFLVSLQAFRDLTIVKILQDVSQISYLDFTDHFIREQWVHVFDQPMDPYILNESC